MQLITFNKWIDLQNSLDYWDPTAGIETKSIRAHEHFFFYSQGERASIVVKRAPGCGCLPSTSSISLAQNSVLKQSHVKTLHHSALRPHSCSYPELWSPVSTLELVGLCLPLQLFLVFFVPNTTVWQERNRFMRQQKSVERDKRETMRRVLSLLMWHGQVTAHYLIHAVGECKMIA